MLDSMAAILIASDNKDMCDSLEEYLKESHAVSTALSEKTCLDTYCKQRFDFVFIDLSIFKMELHSPIDVYKSALNPFWKTFPSAQFVVMTSIEKTRYAVNAVRAGASDYLTFPVDPTELKLIIGNLQEKLIVESELDYLRDQYWKDEALDFVRTNSPKMREVYKKIKSVAETKMTVLLTGETGTGKGVLAKLIHLHSNRNDNQFISLHCGAIPENLVESELFGHEKGSFTGAEKRKLGKFEIAQGGTVFLDEIGTVVPSTQIKLLQVLQDNVFQRVGGEKDIQAEVRVIAATNENLKEMVEQGNFRSDLFYRLCVFPIEIPPLRERIEDVPHIVKTLIKKYDCIYGKNISGVRNDVLEALQAYAWPGNIRELENVIERAYIIETSPVLSPESFPLEIIEAEDNQTHIHIDVNKPLVEVRQYCVKETERQYLKQLMEIHKGKINKVAEAAGVSTRQLHNLLVTQVD